MYKYKTVYGLLKDPKHWARGVQARTKHGGRECEISEGTAFCLLGATARVYRQQEGKEKAADARIKSAIESLYPGYEETAFFNDNRKIRHADVLRVLKAAGV